MIILNIFSSHSCSTQLLVPPIITSSHYYFLVSYYFLLISLSPLMLSYYFILCYLIIYSYLIVYSYLVKQHEYFLLLLFPLIFCKIHLMSNVFLPTNCISPQTSDTCQKCSDSNTEEILCNWIVNDDKKNMAQLS